jgi:hypothetical protein
VEASYDYFVGALRCKSCGKVSAEDNRTNMQTAVRDHRALESLGKGARVQIDPSADIEGRGYRLVHPAENDALTLLQTWACPHCNAGGLWARVVIKGGVIAEVAAIDLNRRTLEEASYIAEDAIDVARRLSGRSYDDLLDQDVVAVLRNHLPAEGDAPPKKPGGVRLSSAESSVTWTLDLDARAPVILGRETVPVITVDRRHAELRYEGGWLLSDLGSTSGTYLNDERLVRPTRIKAGDTIRVGTFRIRVE